MLGYRKRSYIEAHSLLTKLRGNLEDLDSLKQLQQLLLREIVRTEKTIRKLKAECKGLKNSAGAKSKKRNQYLKNRIERVRQVAYVWRCFGDAIAFLYTDKFALKQVFYNTHNTNPKQDAGFVSDKPGLALEIAFLEAALSHGVPALLVDLTNTIRHGDVCLMSNLEPQLIEVKASRNLDRRGRKQRTALAQLNTFLETDKVQGLRGFSEMRRVSTGIPERDHLEALNACIAAAIRDGHAICQPENGLVYVVISEHKKSLHDILDELKLKRPWAFGLNELRATRSWAPYTPFVLSIKNQDHLWSFIRGELFLLVFVEIQQLCQSAIDRGFQATFNSGDELYPLKIDLPGFDRPCGISKHFLTRIGLEFVSLDWAVEASISAIEKAKTSIEAEHDHDPL